MLKVELRLKTPWFLKFYFPLDQFQFMIKFSLKKKKLSTDPTPQGSDLNMMIS